MSIFDPQGLYRHRLRYSKKGQIQQKRPIKNIGALSEKDIPLALNVLQTYNYISIPKKIWDKSIVFAGNGNIYQNYSKNRTYEYTLQEFYNTFSPNILQDIKSAYEYGIISCVIHIDYYSIYSNAPTYNNYTSYQLNLPNFTFTPSTDYNHNIYTSSGNEHFEYSGINTTTSAYTNQIISKSDTAVGICDYDITDIEELNKLIQGTSDILLFSLETNNLGTGVSINIPIGLLISIILK